MASVEELMTNGYEARRDDRLEDARQCFAQAVALSRVSPHTQKDLARSLNGLAQIERDEGRNEHAQRCYEEASALLRQIDEPLRLAHTIRHLADVLRHRDDTAAAEASYAEALALYRSNPDTPPLDLANLLRGYALLKTNMGQRSEAASLWSEAGALYKGCGIEAGAAESRRQIEMLSA
ncbi:tetratricopeptide repeat protein [Silvibacterium sp.]|uniref:tetratricopeptide repeat protein n=1 Tax=Silvibacterium sp. TaxID=1964179 RepID=UPI0039E5F372